MFLFLYRRATDSWTLETNPPQPERRSRRGRLESPERGEGEYIPGGHGGFCRGERGLRELFPGSQAGTCWCLRVRYAC